MRSGRVGESRLTGGRSDPDGAWAYGRLEVFDGSFFSSISETQFSEELGRRGAQVACRSLGFASGAQILSSTLSALPGEAGEVNTLGIIACLGDEANLGECEFQSDYSTDYGSSLEDGAVALVCSNPSGAAPPSTCMMFTLWFASTLVVALCSAYSCSNEAQGEPAG